MNPVKNLYLLATACIFFFPAISQSECDVQEVIEMTKDDMSTRMIRKACDNSVDVPDCRLSKVIRLARQGNNEDKIYELCEESVPSPQNLESNDGLPSGSVVRPCGCWGFAQAGARDREPSCASGWGVAVPCQNFCPTGGVQWGVKCL